MTNYNKTNYKLIRGFIFFIYIEERNISSQF